jgi:DNA (cytosine-5)-methyltransferase 3A
VPTGKTETVYNIEVESDHSYTVNNCIVHNCTYWSISAAGSNGHRETTASGMGWDLFSQYVRALREVKPRWFLYENNATMADDIRKCITDELCVNPVMIDSADFSAQHRKRLYWTNIPVLPYTPVTTLFSDIMEHNVKRQTRDFSKYKDTVRVSADGMMVRWDTSGKGYYSQTNRARKPHQKWNTVPASLGGNDKNNIWEGGTTALCCTAIELERLQTLPDNYTSALSAIGKRFRAIGNGWTVEVIAHLLSGLPQCASVTQEDLSSMEVGSW